ncbi:hypothetical protein KQ874_01620 [Mycoplasma sp. ES3157-GEN-MYC]|uniref:Uncharacterized protein n=1 Tax=Mycoplasma miroungigenitalium TaxID=754515 RepID=A0A6M4JBK8_9MOLU|nr:hypothetical protein [Mycoplasma miroungigenitalium]MBU4690387.1 hypothetical protein [Mycoplasma miroungigenitalium]MBU4691654.1 hypothetical protein [Mycoplasma miroungigenitalium]QJR43479.1 hypothetical protein HLA87_01605 [Mycoplasma miroungigenitalium]
MKRQYLNINSTAELWKLEKTTFRKYVIGSLISILIVTAVILVHQISQFILQYKNGMFATKTDNSSVLIYVLIPLFYIAIWVWISISYILGMIKSYQNKSFEHLKPGTATFFGIMSFISFFDIITFFISKGNTSNVKLNTLQIIQVVLPILISFLTISLYYGFVRETKFIYIAFANAKQFELIKTIGQSTNMFSDLNNIFNHNSMSPESSQNQRPNQPVNETEAEIVKSDRQQKIEKLLMLPNHRLYEMAKKLYISGYEKMEKEELVNKIIDITDKK